MNHTTLVFITHQLSPLNIKLTLSPYSQTHRTTLFKVTSPLHLLYIFLAPPSHIPTTPVNNNSNSNLTAETSSRQQPQLQRTKTRQKLTPTPSLFLYTRLTVAAPKNNPSTVHLTQNNPDFPLMTAATTLYTKFHLIKH